MKLPKAEPATPEEAAEMLEVLLTGAPRSPTVLALDSDTRAEHLERLAARGSEAGTLDAFHVEPLPPGYVVIFVIDSQRRTLYSLRTPPRAEDATRLCSPDMRVVLAEAWDHYYTRWPDGVTPELLDRLVHEPSVPGCYVRRTLWELGLHHLAYASSVHAGNLIAKDPSRSAAEREAALEYILHVQTTSGPLEALRVARLAYFIGASPDEDSEQALDTFCEDPQTVLPWISLFSRYMNRAHPTARRWWSEACFRFTSLPSSTEDAERRMAVAVARAWAATLLMAQACAVELSADGSPGLAEDSASAAVHAMQRIARLRLVPPSETNARDLMRWAKRVLRKGSPRLMKILDGQFVYFGKSAAASP